MENQPKSCLLSSQVDFISAFNTIDPSRLIIKLTDLLVQVDPVLTHHSFHHTHHTQQAGHPCFIDIHVHSVYSTYQMNLHIAMCILYLDICCYYIVHCCTVLHCCALCHMCLLCPTCDVCTVQKFAIKNFTARITHCIIFVCDK